jgi:hypothetical protein
MACAAMALSSHWFSKQRWLLLDILDAGEVAAGFAK